MTASGTSRPLAHPTAAGTGTGLKRVRGGQRGAGFFGRALAAAADEHPSFDVVAVSDLDSAAAAAVADQLGTTACSPQDLTADDDVDLVMVATPNHTHVDAACAALTAGKDVFVEKPLAIEAAGAQRVVDASLASGRRLLVGHVLRCLPGITRLRDVLRSGGVGTALECYGARTRVVHVPAGSSDWWKLDRARSGGELLHEIHELDLMVWLLGRPESVSGTSGGHARSDHRSGPRQQSDHPAVDTVHSTTMRFPGGAVGHHLVSTSAHRAEWTLRVSGTDGAIEVDFRAAQVTRYVDSAAVESWGVFDDPEANDSLAQSATRAQAYNQPGAAGPSWIRQAVTHELDHVAAAVAGDDNSLEAEPAGAVLVALEAMANDVNARPAAGVTS